MAQQGQGSAAVGNDAGTVRCDKGADIVDSIRTERINGRVGIVAHTGIRNHSFQEYRRVVEAIVVIQYDKIVIHLQSIAKLLRRLGVLYRTRYVANILQRDGFATARTNIAIVPQTLRVGLTISMGATGGQDHGKVAMLAAKVFARHRIRVDRRAWLANGGLIRASQGYGKKRNGELPPIALLLMQLLQGGHHSGNVIVERFQALACRCS